MLNKIWLRILALLAITVLMAIVVRGRNARVASQIWRSLATPPPTEKFTPEMVADLPEPVGRSMTTPSQLASRLTKKPLRLP
ncbi:MAG: hypothetical protein ACFB4I_03555 [Cyanophyceae cyanobacterium]